MGPWCGSVLLLLSLIPALALTPEPSQPEPPREVIFHVEFVQAEQA